MFNLFVELYGNWQLRNKAKSIRNQTINELSKLSEKDLNDIGLGRGHIRSVAQQQYENTLAIIAEDKKIDKIKTLASSNVNLKGWV